MRSRTISRSDMIAEDWHIAMRELKRKYEEMQSNAMAGWQEAQAINGLKVIRDIDSRAKSVARERLRSQGIE